MGDARRKWWQRLNPFRGGRLSTPPAKGALTAAATRPVEIGGLDSLKRFVPPHIGNGDLERFERAMSLLGLEFKGVTLGQLMQSWKVGTPERQWWNFETAVRSGYMASAWVFACVYRNAQALARLPWRMEKRVGSNEWAPLKEAKSGRRHPLEMLMERPNPWQGGSDLRARQVIHLMLGGNTLLLKNRAGNPGERSTKAPGELILAAPNNIEVVPGDPDLIAAYRVVVDGLVKATLPPSEVVHWQLPDPLNPRWGMAPMVAAARPTDIDTQASEWQLRGFANNARPSLVISHEKDLTDKQHEKAKERLREEILGPENALMPLLLGHAAKLQNMSMSPQEMDWFNTRGFTREEIGTVFGVPPPIMGIFEDAALANIQTSREIWWLDTLLPLASAYRDCLNGEQGLTRDFEDPEELRVSYDTRHVEALAGMRERQEMRAERLWKMGVPLATVNEHLGLGLPENIPGSEIPYVPSTMTPAGEAGAEQPADVDDTEGKAGEAEAWRRQLEAGRNGTH